MVSTVCVTVTSSPFSSISLIQQLITDEGKNHPISSKVFQIHIYVDDALLGTSTVEEALDLQQDVIRLLQKGRFELRKWSKNDLRFLENQPTSRLPWDASRVPHAWTVLLHHFRFKVNSRPCCIYLHIWLILLRNFILKEPCSPQSSRSLILVTVYLQ